MTAIHHYLKPGTGLPSREPTTPPGTGTDAGARLGFGDLLDMINPLHHIPVVGTVYRKLSGDSINPVMKIAGGALFGGPLGAAVSIASVTLNHAMETRDSQGVPAGGVDPISVASYYPVEQQPQPHAPPAAKRTLHVNADIFRSDSQNPAARVTFITTKALLAARPADRHAMNPGLQRLLGTYIPLTEDAQDARVATAEAG